MAGAFIDAFESVGKDGAIKTVDLLTDGPGSLAAVARELGLGPAAVIAAVAHAALGDGPAYASPALSQGRPRLRTSAALSAPSVAELYPGATRQECLALSAGLLQIHEFWEASHEAAQEAGDLGEARVSAYWHAVAHRREPDPGNAAYWFRRVGRHPVFKPLADTAGPLLVGHPRVAGQLLHQGDWDPFAFIDVCTRARGEGAVLAGLARSLQRLEMLLLLEASLPV